MEKVKLLMNKYELGKLLGQGNFAKVYYARNLHTNQAVAVKVIDKDKVLKVGLDLQLKREISIMGMLRHRNVLQVYEVMASKSKIYIVLEYAKGGELFNKVAQGRLKEDVARWVFQQLISAVDFCHTRGVCHRDLKLENLLLDEAGNLKVSDFGLSTLLPDDGLLRTFCGTPTYVAPEVIIKKGYDGAKADIWSCGVILYSMLAGHLPFLDSNLNEIYRKIRRAEYKCPIWFPPEVHRLLAKILDPNPKRRISIAKIKENAWFKKGLGTKPAILESGAREASNAAIETTSVQESGALPFKSMNAFEFISLSSGFDLSGLFVEDEQKDGARFISQQPASDIATKLKEAAAEFRMEVANKEGVFLRLSRADEEGNGSMMIDVEVSELAEKFHLVELKKSGGDSLDYRRLMKDMRPKLKEIVWAWQGNQIFRPEQFTL